MNPTLVLNLPPKFISLLQEAVAYRISSMQIINDDLRNINNQIKSDFYQLSQNESSTQTTLKLFGKPIDEKEEIIFVFSAKSYDDAMTIRNRFLGFPLYKPMPDN